jgi:hypothetical protein
MRGRWRRDRAEPSRSGYIGINTLLGGGNDDPRVFWDALSAIDKSGIGDCGGNLRIALAAKFKLRHYRRVRE